MIIVRNESHERMFRKCLALWVIWRGRCVAGGFGPGRGGAGCHLGNNIAIGSGKHILAEEEGVWEGEM